MYIFELCKKMVVQYYEKFGLSSRSFPSTEHIVSEYSLINKELLDNLRWLVNLDCVLMSGYTGNGRISF